MGRPLDRYMDVSAPNQRRSIGRQRVEACDPEQVQESTYAATC